MTSECRPATRKEHDSEDAWDFENERPVAFRVARDAGLWITPEGGAPFCMHLTRRGRFKLARQLARTQPPQHEFDDDEFHSTAEFARYMLLGDHLFLRPVFNLIHADARGTRVVLFRSGRWQVELIVARPDSVIPPHCHDHVDSVELLLADSGGQVVLRGRELRSRRIHHNGLNRPGNLGGSLV